MPIVQKTAILTSGTTWTVPDNLTSVIAVHAIGGGCCGSPGSDGAVRYESLEANNLIKGGGGPGATYCRVDTPAGILPGQVLDIHVAAASVFAGTLNEWEDRFFIDPLSDDTWLKDINGDYIIFAPGGDSLDDPVGDVQFFGGQGGGPGSNVTPGGAGGGGAGGPGCAPDIEAGTGGSGDFVNPTVLRLFGSGGGAGNTPSASGQGGDGQRTSSGAGSGDAGDGGTITPNPPASGSLLLPSVTFPVGLDGVIAAEGYSLAGGDWTIEFFVQAPIPDPFGGSAAGGSVMSVWDRSGNQRSWYVDWFGLAGGAALDIVASPDGIGVSIWGEAPASFGAFAINRNLIDRYLDAFFQYFGPANSLAWAHVAIVRKSNKLKLFIDGYPGICLIDSDVHYARPVTFEPFASTAPLAIGGVLDGGNFASDVFLDGSPCTGWIGGIRITLGTALYDCADTTPFGTFLGQQFTPPTAAMTGGDFNCDWPGTKGGTTSSATDENGAAIALTFKNNAQIDTDQYCYAPLEADAEVGNNGQDAPPGAALWTDTDNPSQTAGPGSGGGGGGGHIGRYRMVQGGDGGDGGLYGGGGGMGGFVNSGLYVDLGFANAIPGSGGVGAPGVLVIVYEAFEQPPPDIIVAPCPQPAIDAGPIVVAVWPCPCP